MIFLVVIPIVYIYIISSQNEILNKLNNKKLEQNAEIIKINYICESLKISILTINNYHIDYNYINKLIIVILINLLSIFLFVYVYYTNIDKLTKIPFTELLIFIIISFIIVFITYFTNKKYISQNSNKFFKKEEEINNKKEEINKIYQSNLIITYENNNFIEYLYNYSYLFNNNMNIDKFKKELN